MHDWRSLSHVRWECKYHVVIVPKCRHKVFYGKMRSRIGPLLRDLCRQRGIELLQGHSMPDHIHLCLSIPPKFSVAHTIGFLKGKSAVRVHRELMGQLQLVVLPLSAPESHALLTAPIRSGLRYTVTGPASPAVSPHFGRVSQSSGPTACTYYALC